MRDAADVVDRVATWAAEQADVRAVALVGSHARADATPDSDIDLVLVVEDVDVWLSDQSWLTEFGEVLRVRHEDWGLVQSLRVTYRNGSEVEFGLTTVAWVTAPLDEGTATVIRDGLSAVSDPEGLLGQARQAAKPHRLLAGNGGTTGPMTASGPVVRRAGAGDAAAIAALQVRSWKAAYRGIAPDAFLAGLAEGAWLQRWNEQLGPPVSEGIHQLVAAEAPSAPAVAVAVCGPALQPLGECTGQLYVLYADPVHWGRGCGAALLRRVHQLLAADGHRAALLWVAAQNGRAIGFYEHHGWVRDGQTQREEVAGATFDEVRMVRDLVGWTGHLGERPRCGSRGESGDSPEPAHLAQRDSPLDDDHRAEYEREDRRPADGSTSGVGSNRTGAGRRSLLRSSRKAGRRDRPLPCCLP